MKPSPGSFYPHLTVLRLQCLLALATLLSGQLSIPAALVAIWGDTNSTAVPLPPGLTNVKAVAGGGGFSLALKPNGTVVAWGKPDWRNDHALVVPAGLSNVTAIAAGAHHALALTSTGRVVAWGYGIFGETNVPPTLTNAVAVAAGYHYSMALKSDGTVVAWGSAYGNPTNVPAGLSDVKAIAGGGSHSLALKHDGTVTQWGIHPPMPAGLSNVIAIAASYDLSLALKADGRVVAWGGNNYGQTNVPPDLDSVTAVAAGFGRGLALRSDGGVVVWGRTLVEPPVPTGLSNVLTIAGGHGQHHLALVHAGPIQILAGPESRLAAYESDIAFSVTATGLEPLNYQWFRNGQPLSDGGRILGATTASLVISAVEFDDAGTYTVVVGNTLGSVLSPDATLTVGHPPTITSQSSNQVVGAGSAANLAVTAEGTPPLSYQWSWFGTNLPNRTLSSLYIPNAQPGDSGDYTVTVSNAFGLTSATIGLLVTNRAPIITQQPSLMTTNLRSTLTSPVPVGSSVAMRVFATGSLPLQYQWHLDGTDLPGATNAILLLEHLRLDQSGYYGVEVRNAHGATHSTKLLLNVSQVAVAGLPLVGNINMPLGLSDVTALAAGPWHVMALKTNGTVLTWLANSNYVSLPGSIQQSLTNVPATATNVIAIAAGRDHCLALRSNGTVVAWGAPGSHTNVPVGLSDVVGITAGWNRSYAVKLDGTVTGWGSSATVTGGLSNVVAMAAGGSQDLALWRDGTVGFEIGRSLFLVPGLSNAIAVVTGPNESLALRADGTVVRWPAGSLSVPIPVMDGTNAVAVAAGANYTRLILAHDGRLVASSVPGGTFPTTSNLTAIAAGGFQAGYAVMLVGDGSPVFTLHPVSQVAVKGDTIHLHARSVGAPPPPPLRFQWQRDGLNLPGATNASLVLSNILGRDGGAYRVIASNALGTATSRVAHVSVAYNTNLAAALNATNLVWSTFSAPTPTTNGWFAQNRETHDDDVAAQSGPISHNQQSILQTTVTGPGTLSFWWKVSSEPNYDFLRFYWNNLNTPYASISGETEWRQVTITLGSGTHTLRWAYVKDWSVNMGRDCGWLDEVIFTAAPPLILLEPDSQTVFMGEDVTISAVVAGTPPLALQWLKDGNELPGATAQHLTLTNVTRGDSGSYTLRVSNVGGTMTSSNATLRVLVPQLLGVPARSDDGSVRLLSGDADGGALTLDELPAFEAHASTNLLDWELLPGALTLTNGSLLLRDTNAMHHPRRFYRIVEH